MARLHLFQRIVVVNVLRCVVKIDQYLGVSIRQKPVYDMFVLNALVIIEELNELAQREYWNVNLVDHRQSRSARAGPNTSLLQIVLFDLLDLFNAAFVAAAFEICRKPRLDYLFLLFVGDKSRS